MCANSHKFNGERYLTGVRGRFTRVSALNYQEVGGDLPEGDAYDALDVRISYIEMANTRMVRFIFTNDGGVLVQFLENPGSDFLLKNLEYLTADLVKGKGKLTEQLANKVYNDVFKERIRAALELSIRYKIEKEQ